MWLLHLQSSSQIHVHLEIPGTQMFTDDAQGYIINVDHSQSCREGCFQFIA